MLKWRKSAVKCWKCILGSKQNIDMSKGIWHISQTQVKVERVSYNETLRQGTFENLMICGIFCLSTYSQNWNFYIYNRNIHCYKSN